MTTEMQRWSSSSFILPLEVHRVHIGALVVLYPPPPASKARDPLLVFRLPAPKTLQACRDCLDIPSFADVDAVHGRFHVVLGALRTFSERQSGLITPLTGK